MYTIAWVMDMKALKDRVSITLDGDLLEKARKEAEKDDRSLSQYINLALREYLARHGEKEKT